MATKDFRAFAAREGKGDNFDLSRCFLARKYGNDAFRRGAFFSLNRQAFFEQAMISDYETHVNEII